MGNCSTPAVVSQLLVLAHPQSLEGKVLVLVQLLGLRLTCCRQLLFPAVCLMSL